MATTKKANAKTARKKTAKKATKKTASAAPALKNDTVVEGDEFSNPELLQDVSSADLQVVGEQAAKETQAVERYLPPELEQMDLRKKVIDLRREVDNGSFEIGKILYFIKANEEHKEWGFETFADYVNSEEAGQKRRVRYLVELHEWFEKDIKDKPRIEAIKALGWSKAIQVKKAIADTEDREEAVDNWVDRAGELSLKKLTDTVKEETAKSAPTGETDHTKPVNADETHKMTFSLYNEQYESVIRALDVAKKDSNSEVPSQNLSLICQQFLMDADMGKNFEESRMKWLPKLEERFKIKLVAVDSDTDEVIYGQELLDGDGD